MATALKLDIFYSVREIKYTALKPEPQRYRWAVNTLRGGDVNNVLHLYSSAMLETTV